MQAYTLTAPTGPDALHLTTIAVPTPAADEVLLQVKALSVNPVDLKTTLGKGMYGRLKDEHPLIPGWDVAGVITQVGAAVTQFGVGDEVFGMVNFPGHGRVYAEYVVAPASQLASKPATISYEAAAAATLAALTAWQVLVPTAQVQAGQRVLVHAAAGGVGHYAVQLAKELGAYVIGTASAGNRDFVLGLGADEFVDYQQVRFEEAVAPVDMVFDTIGGENAVRSLDVVKPSGILVSIPSGLSPDLATLAAKRGVRSPSFMVASSGADQAQLAARLADGRLRSHVSETFPFAQLPAALHQLATGRTRGKIVATL